MTANQFEQVDAPVDDAMTLRLFRRDEKAMGAVTCPAAATGGKLPMNYASGTLPAKDALRGAIKFANDLKVAIVVVDPEGVWDSEWGELYRTVDEGED